MSVQSVLVPMAWSDGEVIRPLNRPARRLLGADERSAESLLDAGALGAWSRLVMRCERSGASLWLLLQAQISPGVSRDLRVGMTPDGTGGFHLTLIDRTEQREAQARGQRSSQFLKELLNQTPTIFFVVDRGGQVVFRNGAFDQLVGGSVEVLSAASMPQLTTDFHRTLGELFRTGTKQQIRVLSTSASGLTRQLQFELDPLRDATGRTHQALVVGFDLTELMGAHAEQRRLQGELEQAGRLGALGQMAGTIAHDFNNFLSVMMASTQMLRELIPVVDEDIDETLSDLEQVTQRARALTQDLVAFSRAQVHAVRSSRLDEVVAAIQASLPRLVPPSVLFALELPEVSVPSAEMVPLSASQILQIAVNIVQNAVEAGRSDARIEVIVSKSVDRLELSFADDGPGVPESVRDRIFEPFFTTRGDSGGTGLGLSSARTLVERVGGTLKLETSRYGGALFRVQLPMQRRAEAASK